MSEVIEAKVRQVQPLTNSILQIVLEAQDVFVDYIPGQYLQIIFGEENLYYSIANAPLGSKDYEIHLRHIADNATHKKLLEEISNQGKLKIALPFGNCHLRKLADNKPLLFIAAGTGFAPIKAMIEQLLTFNDERSFELFWGARTKSDLYFEEQVLNWQSHVKNFKYFSVLSTTGRSNLADNVIRRHKVELCDLDDWQIIISGSFDFVFSTRDLLVSHGVDSNNLFSDAFDFE